MNVLSKALAEYEKLAAALGMSWKIRRNIWLMAMDGKMKTHLAYHLYNKTRKIKSLSAISAFAGDVVYSQVKRNHPQVLTAKQSLKLIAEKRASVGRFGDGEYKLIRGKSLRFQSAVPELVVRLKQVFYSNVPGFYVGFREIADYQNRPQFFAHEKHNLIRNWQLFAKLSNELYLSSYLSGIMDLTVWNLVFHGREIILITNSEMESVATQTKLFCKAAKLHFIQAPAEQAFSQYDSLLNQASEHREDCLYLLACGPVATVLAFDLHNSGRQAVDIGHFIYRFKR